MTGLRRKGSLVVMITIVGAVLIASTTAACILSWYAWRQRPTRGSVLFSLLMLAMAEYAFTVALELASPTISAKIFWSKIQYLGISNVPPLWLLFAFSYAQYERWLRARRAAWLWIAPVLVILLVATNELHHLAWTSVHPLTDQPGGLVKYEHGPVILSFAAYSYVLMLLGSALLILTAYRSARLYRLQIAALVIAALLPWCGNVLYITRLSPFQGFDLAPFALVVSGFLIAWAIFRFRLLHTIPMAYEAVLADMSEGVVLIDPSGHIADLNAAAELLLGIGEDAIGLPAATALPPWLAPALAAREVIEFETRPTSENLRWFEATANPLYGSEEQLTGTLLLIRDTTARKQAEEKLRKSEERFRQIAENAKEWIWEVDKEGLYTFVGPVVEEILGYRPEEIVGKKHFYDFFHPEDRERLKDAALAAFGRKQVLREFINRNVAKNGAVVWLSTSGMAISDEQGDFLGYRGADADITERKRAEEALRQSEARFRTLVESSPVGIWLDTADGETAYVNPAMFDLLEIDDPQELSGLNWQSFFTPESLNTIARQRSKRETGEASSYEVEMVGKRGVKLSFFVRGTPLLSQDGTLEGTLGIFVDITERKQAELERQKIEVQMQHAQKLESLGVLAGGIAHDFNNILAVILGNAELAMQGLPESSRARPCLEEVRKAVQRAAHLANQMLAYSGRGRFRIVYVDLSEIVARMDHLLTSAISKNVSLQMNLEHGLPAVEADTTQIQQLIMNLVVNASEAVGAASEGRVIVTTHVADYTAGQMRQSRVAPQPPGGPYVCLEVTDNGCGMDEETLGKIFDPFFTTKFTGRGLGLAAALGIVRGHKGAIFISSEPEKGTTFRVLFPALNVQPETMPDKQAAIENDVAGRGTILIVDDENSVLTVGKEMLEHLGYSTFTASDGREALDVFQKHHDEIDCVLLDLSMPRMGGEETLRKLRRLKSDLPVIMSSGYHEQEIAARFAGQQIAGFIQKPYQISTLNQELRKVLEPPTDTRAASSPIES